MAHLEVEGLSNCFAKRQSLAKEDNSNLQVFGLTHRASVPSPILCKPLLYAVDGKFGMSSARVLISTPDRLTFG